MFEAGKAPMKNNINEEYKINILKDFLTPLASYVHKKTHSRFSDIQSCVKLLLNRLYNQCLCDLN